MRRLVGFWDGAGLAFSVTVGLAVFRPFVTVGWAPLGWGGYNFCLKDDGFALFGKFIVLRSSLAFPLPNAPISTFPRAPYEFRFRSDGVAKCFGYYLFKHDTGGIYGAAAPYHHELVLLASLADAVFRVRMCAICR